MASVVVKEEVLSDDELKDIADEDTTDRSYTRNGYYYIRDKITKRNPTKTYFRCKQIGKGLCKARATIINGVFTITKPHNHCPNDTAYAEILFKKALRERCLNGFGSARSIYNELLPQHLAAAEKMPFSRIENSMHRWLKKFSPPMPSNLNEFGDLLRTSPWHNFIENSDQEFCNAKLNDTENDICIIIFYNKLVTKKIEDTHILYIDSSYKIIPAINQLSQIVTFLTVRPYIRSQMGIPFIWALMNKTTEKAYKVLLKFIKNELLPMFNPTICVLNYEKSLNSAIIDIFPDVILQRTYYNYCQNILRTAFNLNAIGPDERNVEKLQILYKLMTLALLPAMHVEAGFNCIRDSNETISFLPLMNYFENIWLKKVSGSCFSVYDTIDRMTNLFESYHRMLQYTFQPKQSALDFTKALLKLQTTIKNDVSKANPKSIIRKSSINSMISQREIQTAWKNLMENSMSVEEFINCMNEPVAKGVGTLLVIESGDVPCCREEPDMIEGYVCKNEINVIK